MFKLNEYTKPAWNSSVLIEAQYRPYMHKLNTVRPGQKADILQTTVSNAFSGEEIGGPFWFKFRTCDKSLSGSMMAYFTYATWWVKPTNVFCGKPSSRCLNFMLFLRIPYSHIEVRTKWLPFCRRRLQTLGMFNQAITRTIYWRIVNQTVRNKRQWKKLY